METEIIQANDRAELVVGGHTLNEEQSDSYTIVAAAVVTDESGTALPLVTTDAQADCAGDLIVHFEVEGSALAAMFAAAAEIIADERSRETGTLDLDGAASDAVDATYCVIAYLYETGALESRRNIALNGRLDLNDRALSERMTSEVQARLDCLLRIAARHIGLCRELHSDSTFDETMDAIVDTAAQLASDLENAPPIGPTASIEYIDIDLLAEAAAQYFEVWIDAGY